MEKTAEQLRRERIALEGDTHGKNKWAILFTVLIMTFMVCLDSTVVTVALPVMQKELGVGLDRIQLVSSVYLLAVWPSGRRARQGECVPAGRHRFFGRFAAVRPFGLARGSYSGTHCSGRRLRGGHG